MRRLAAITFVGLAVFAACSDPPRVSLDAAIDAVADPCQTCRSDQICVARYDGTCRRMVECVALTVVCLKNTCSSACEMAYCPSPYQCQNRAACSGEPPQAFTCYGP
jgi:hypothetical protein